MDEKEQTELPGEEMDTQAEEENRFDRIKDGLGNYLERAMEIGKNHGLYLAGMLGGSFLATKAIREKPENESLKQRLGRYALTVAGAGITAISLLSYLYTQNEGFRGYVDKKVAEHALSEFDSDGLKAAMEVYKERFDIEF